MSLHVIIYRVNDGLPLFATSSSNSGDYLAKANKVIKTLNKKSPIKCFIDIDQEKSFYYILEENLCYIVTEKRDYPKKLLVKFLEEIIASFKQDLQKNKYDLTRPYAAYQFEQSYEKIRKKFINPTTADNLEKLNESLLDIKSIIHKNINDILIRGDKLDSLETSSRYLFEESRKFKKETYWLNFKAFYDKCAPLILVLVILLLYIILKLWY